MKAGLKRRALQVEVTTGRGLAPAIREQLEHPGRVLKVVDGRVVVAVAVEGSEPWRRCVELADRVQKVLERLGVDHWTVNDVGSRVVQWGIRWSDFTVVFAALADELGDEPYYLESSKAGSLPRLVREGPDPAVLGQAQSTRIFQYVDDAGLVNDSDVVCKIFAWDATDRGTLKAPDRGGVVSELDDLQPLPVVEVADWSGAVRPRPAALATPDFSDIDFGIDAVYTWVDGSDPAWLDRRNQTYRRLAPDAADSPLESYRYRDRGELRASLRSLELYAPWIRRIYLVTDAQRPAWLDPESQRVRVVDHREIFADPSVLPTFNSHAIGAQLHRIPGLSSRYLVINDDVLFNEPVEPGDFFTPEGLLRVMLSRTRRPLIDREKQSPLEQARANSAWLIERDFGRRPTRVFAHVPIPQSREVAEEVAERYADELARTSRMPFRSADDYEANSWLHLNLALLTGRAVRGELPFNYVDVGDAATGKRSLTRKRLSGTAVICMNDTPAHAESVDESAWLEKWLADRYPKPAGHELA